MEPNIEVATDPTSGEVLPEQQAPTTTWVNRTENTIRFVLNTSRRKRITGEDGFSFEVDEQIPHEIVIEPGATRKLLSIYDRAIHAVTACGHVDCRQGICRTPGLAGPTAHCGGGLAPLLERVDQKYSIDPSLIPRRGGAAQRFVAPADVGRFRDRVDVDEGDPAMQRARARAKAGGR